MNFINSGVLSVNNKKVYRQYIAEEYQEAFFKFTDISTLPERMKNEETIAMEYRMKDGNWHKLRFIEKKRDTNGNLTHVLCACLLYTSASGYDPETNSIPDRDPIIQKSIFQRNWTGNERQNKADSGNQEVYRTVSYTHLSRKLLH